MSKSQNRNKRPDEIVNSLLQNEDAQKLLSEKIKSNPDSAKLLISQINTSLALNHQSTTIVNNVLPVSDIKMLHELNPDYGKKYFELLEKQTDNRIKLEQTAIKGSETRANKGISSFTLISISLILSSMLIFIFGNEEIIKYVFSGSFAGIPFITRLVSFMYSKIKKHNKLDQTKENKIERKN